MPCFEALRVTPLETALEVVVVDSKPVLDPAVHRAVETAWDEEQARRGDLFNGRVFSVFRRSGTRLEGGFVEYKWFVAQQRNPALYSRLGITMLAVSGLLETADGVVFGRRAATVMQDGDRWELVPSGGIGPESCNAQGEIALERQLLLELTEETGLPESSVTRPGPFVLVEDVESHVIDVGLRFRCKLDPHKVSERLAGRCSSEYRAMEIVPVPNLDEFLRRVGPRLVSVSRILLQQAGLISVATDGRCATPGLVSL